MKKPIKTKQNLPEGIIASDKEYPEFDWKKKKQKDEVIRNEDHHGQLTFYEVESRKGETYWCIATLLIGRAGRRAPAGASDRTYAVRMDGELVRVGIGPHVKQTVTIHIKKSREKELQKFVDLHRKGLTEANQIRDRIGSRRAQGQLHRAAGHRSWALGLRRRKEGGASLLLPISKTSQHKESKMKPNTWIDVSYNTASSFGPGYSSGSRKMEAKDLPQWITDQLAAYGKPVLITDIRVLK